MPEPTVRIRWERISRLVADVPLSRVPPEVLDGYVKGDVVEVFLSGLSGDRDFSRETGQPWATITDIDRAPRHG